MFVDRLHAGEQLGIERDVVRQLGQLGLHAHGDLLHLVRGIGAQKVEEDARNAAEQLALTLQRHDRVHEGRLLRVADDRLDLGPRAGDRRVEGRFIILEFDPREGRCGVGRIPRGQQRIREIQFGQVGPGNRIVGASGRKCRKGHDEQCFFHRIRFLGFTFGFGGYSRRSAPSRAVRTACTSAESGCSTRCGAASESAGSGSFHRPRPRSIGIRSGSLPRKAR